MRKLGAVGPAPCARGSVPKAVPPTKRALFVMSPGLGTATLPMVLMFLPMSLWGRGAWFD